MARHRARLDKCLRRWLPRASRSPQSLHRAMRYSVLGGGKRIRPVLCLETASLFRSARGAENLGCAIELIHAYSLIHDDLPALDNDDLRRGRPTCHRKFGEATAILAGDALLTLAFEVLARMPVRNQRCRARIIAEIASAAGTCGGMIAGQVADLEAEGRRIAPRQLETIHRGKTGALIRAAVRTGVLYAGASARHLQRMTRYGEKLGLAFQIVDDLLDVHGSTRQLGKKARKDTAQQKATYPAVHGLEKSQRVAAQLVEEACAALAPYGRRARPLQEIARYILTRAA